MAKVTKEFKWKYSLVQDGMVYYRRVVPEHLRSAHNLPAIIKKATGVPKALAAEAVVAITKLNTLQEREWAQLDKGINGTTAVNKLLSLLKKENLDQLRAGQFEVNDVGDEVYIDGELDIVIDAIRDYVEQILEKSGQIPPELALLLKMKDLSNIKTLPTVLSVALANYLSRHKNPSDGLIYDSTSCINRFIRINGDIDVQEITREMVHTYVKDRLNKTIKTTTVRRELNQLSAIVNKAFLELEIDKKSPFASIDIPSEGSDKLEIKPITKAKLETLLVKIRESKSTSHIIAKILLNTGMRVSELVVAKTSDVHLLDDKKMPLAIPFISISPNSFRSLKNKGSERNVPLVGISLDAMHEAIRQAEGSEYLFPRYGKKGGGNNASAAVNTALNFVDINTHDFRHFISTRMRESMIPLDVREAITGHSSKNSSQLKDYGEGYQLEQTHPVLLKVSID